MNATHSYGLAGIADHLQTYGRNGDTVLVHMTPGEVRGLQALAVQHGGTLTINPHTGLVEASFLKKLLPTIAGIALNFVPGVGPLLAAGLTAAVSTAASGSLKKGLMAGLQAYGGASLATGLGMGAASAGAGAATSVNAGVGATQGLASSAPVTLNAAPGAVGGLVPTATSMGNIGASLGTGAVSAAAPAAQLAAGYTPQFAASLPGAAGAAAQAAPASGLMGMLPQGMQGFGTNFAAAAREGIPAGAPGFVSKFAPHVAGMGVMSTASDLMKPKELRVGDPEPSNYDGPYVLNEQNQNYREAGDLYKTYYPPRAGVHRMSPELEKFSGYPPYRAPTTGKDNDKIRRSGYAAGGVVLEDGAFVMDARTVSELGNGSSGAGQEALKRVGGKPIKGRGDGTSDSIRAKMGGKEARVARDEVKIPAKAVKKLGRGNHSRGATKLYDLMDKTKQARSTSERGQDNGLVSLFGA